MARKHSKTLARASRFPIYLWIAGAYPILHLYDQNFGLVRDSEVAQTIAAMLSATTLAFLIAKPIAGSPHKRALLLTIWSLAFSLGGRFYEELFHPRSLVAWTIGALLLAFMAAITLRNRLPKAACAQLTAPLNLIFGLLLALPLISLLPDALAQRNYLHASAAYFQTPGEPRNTTKIMDSPDRPDIYYIIPDAYPSDAALLTALDYDNAAFTNALRERGFVIAPHAQSNYLVTSNSLAATLNMRYFESNPSDYSDLDYLRLTAANSQVARLLQSLGYTYINYLSGFVFPSPMADINRDFGPNGSMDIQIGEHYVDSRATVTNQTKIPLRKLRQPFASLYLDSTLLRGLRSLLADLLPTDQLAVWHRSSGERFLATLDDLQAVAAMPEATFTIAHLMQPHAPANFNARGEIIAQIKQLNRREILADMQGSNLHFLRAIDSILQTSQNQPIIIFQADHGMNFASNSDDDRVLYQSYAAYYLPDDYQLQFPDPYTLINSFPLILNEVFAMDYPLQPDRLFAHPQGYDALFVQTEITELFKREQA